MKKIMDSPKFREKYFIKDNTDLEILKQIEISPFSHCCTVYNQTNSILIKTKAVTLLGTFSKKYPQKAQKFYALQNSNN